MFWFRDSTRIIALLVGILSLGAFLFLASGKMTAKSIGYHRVVVEGEGYEVSNYGNKAYVMLRFPDGDLVYMAANFVPMPVKTGTVFCVQATEDRWGRRQAFWADDVHCASK